MPHRLVEALVLDLGEEPGLTVLRLGWQELVSRVAGAQVGMGSGWSSWPKRWRREP